MLPNDSVRLRECRIDVAHREGEASGDVPGRDLTGDLLAAAALFAWTWYFVAVKRARQNFGALEYQAALALAETTAPDNPYRQQLDALIARLATRTG